MLESVKAPIINVSLKSEFPAFVSHQLVKLNTDAANKFHFSTLNSLLCPGSHVWWLLRDSWLVSALNNFNIVRYYFSFVSIILGSESVLAIGYPNWVSLDEKINLSKKNCKNVWETIYEKSLLALSSSMLTMHEERYWRLS